MIDKRDNEEISIDYPCEWIYKVIGSDKESVHNARNCRYHTRQRIPYQRL